MTEQLRDDCVYLMRLSREDDVLQEAFKPALGSLEAAETRVSELLELLKERANA